MSDNGNGRRSRNGREEEPLVGDEPEWDRLIRDVLELARLLDCTEDRTPALTKLAETLADDAAELREQAHAVVEDGYDDAAIVLMDCHHLEVLEGGLRRLADGDDISGDELRMMVDPLDVEQTNSDEGETERGHKPHQARDGTGPAEEAWTWETDQFPEARTAAMVGVLRLATLRDGRKERTPSLKALADKLANWVAELSDWEQELLRNDPDDAEYWAAAFVECHLLEDLESGLRRLADGDDVSGDELRRMVAMLDQEETSEAGGGQADAEAAGAIELRAQVDREAGEKRKQATTRAADTARGGDAGGHAQEGGPVKAPDVTEPLTEKAAADGKSVAPECQETAAGQAPAAVRPRARDVGADADINSSEGADAGATEAKQEGDTGAQAQGKTPNWSKPCSKTEASEVIGVSTDNINDYLRDNPAAVKKLTRQKWQFDKNFSMFCKLP